MRVFLNKLLFGGGFLFDACKWLILVAVVLILIFRLWLSIFGVDGISMEPNLHDKEFVLLQNNSYNNKEPIRSDIVAVRYPGDPENKKYVKRVVGLPGEKVEIIDGHVNVNGKILQEDYLPFDTTTDPAINGKNSWTLKANEYFLMGDNRPFSNDCRYFGPVEKRFLLGKALFVVFPRLHQLEN